MSGIQASFRHRDWGTVGRRDSAVEGCDPAQKETYFRVIVQKCTELSAALDGQDLNTLFTVIESFINILQPGIQIPNNIFADSQIFPKCLSLLAKSLDNPRLLNELAWLLSRITHCTSDVDSLLSGVELRDITNITKRVGVDKSCFKIWYLVANIGQCLIYTTDVWKLIPSFLPVLTVGDLDSKTLMLVLSKTATSWIVTKCERVEQQFCSVMSQFVTLLQGYLSPDSPSHNIELARIGLFVISDVLDSHVSFLVEHIVPFLCECAFCGNPLIMEPAISALYFALSSVHDLELPIDKIWELATIETPEFEAVQFQAIQLVRLACEFRPSLACDLGIIQRIRENFEKLPFRLQFQCLWLIGQFLWCMDLESIAKYGVANGMDVPTTIIELLQLLMNQSSDVAIAYLTVWSLIGIKYGLARFSSQDMWSHISSAADVDDFIMSCYEMQNSELDEAIDHFTTSEFEKIVSPLAEGQMLVETASQRLAAQESSQAPTRIKFVLGS